MHTGRFPSRRLLVADSLICCSHLSFSSDDDENRRAINPRRGGQHSTVNHHRKASKAAHSSLKSIAYRHHRPSAVSTVSGRIRVLSLAVSYPYVIYVYLRTLNNASVGLGSYASVWCRARRACEPTMNPKCDQIIGEEGSTLRLTTTERRLKPRTSPESQPRLGFTGASKKFCPSSFFFVHHTWPRTTKLFVKSVLGRNRTRGVPC